MSDDAAREAREIVDRLELHDTIGPHWCDEIVNAIAAAIERERQKLDQRVKEEVKAAGLFVSEEVRWFDEAKKLAAKVDDERAARRRAEAEQNEMSRKWFEQDVMAQAASKRIAALEEQVANMRLQAAASQACVADYEKRAERAETERQDWHHVADMRAAEIVALGERAAALATALRDTKDEIARISVHVTDRPEADLVSLLHRLNRILDTTQVRALLSASEGT